ncbi:hypothetical protein BDZ89DRAFT_1151735 [Hymenopellis radicata]|nr:hypothetical protein BDZ89DRAFT_1151735 [Hymenopellis radicata]
MSQLGNSHLCHEVIVETLQYNNGQGRRWTLWSVNPLLNDDDEEDEAESEDDDDDGICEDMNALDNSQYWPYPNKPTMLLDILDNMGRCRFSSTQIKLIIQFAQALGAQDVPSYCFRKLQTKLRLTSGSEPKMHTSYLRNHFYMNDIRETIAWDFANPNIAPHLHLYPEETDGPISETWQAERWKEYDPSELTPMYSRSLRRFWINELAQLKDGSYVIPQTWIVRHGVLHSDISDVTYSSEGWMLNGNQCSVPAAELEWDYTDVIAQIGDANLHWIQSADVPIMPNEMRKLVDDDEDLYVVMVSPWADDVSGNRSKQYNKHMNMYAGNGCLPGRLLQQEFHVHYVSTSLYASSPEQFILELTPTQRTCRIILRIPGLPADNPQQSEEASHMGGNANFPCRKCHWGGNGVYKESDDGYHSCHFMGIKRSATEIRDQLGKQLRFAMHGIESHVEQLQKDSGTKDKVTQHWINQLLARSKILEADHPELTEEERVEILQKWLDEQLGDKMNPLLDIAGLDPSQDTPVELRHTILLGLLKYIWHLLNTSQ